MRRLSLIPTESSYSAEDSGEEYGRVQLDGGKGRYRRYIIGGSRLVDCRWVLAKADYSYLQMFYRVFKNDPQPFLLSLILDEWYLEDCEASFMPGTFRLTEKHGDVFAVTAQLEVVPPYKNVALETDIVDMASAFGPDWMTWADRLDYLMNVALPETLKNEPVP